MTPDPEELFPTAGRTRYTENATGLEVVVESHFTWGVHPPTHFLVRYPGKRHGYIADIATINRHLTIVTPQNFEIIVEAGGIQRPTDKQRELDAELDAKE